MDVEGTVIVDRPIEEVFDAWAALERTPDWADVVIERRKETDGPVGVGTRYHAVDQWPGRRVEFTVEITAFERPDRMAATWSEPMVGGWDAIFETVDGGTEVRLVSSMQPSGLMGALAPLLGFWARRQAGSFMAAFKAWVESGRSAQA